MFSFLKNINDSDIRVESLCHKVSVFGKNFFVILDYYYNPKTKLAAFSESPSLRLVDNDKAEIKRVELTEDEFYGLFNGKITQDKKISSSVLQAIGSLADKQKIADKLAPVTYTFDIANYYGDKILVTPQSKQGLVSFDEEMTAEFLVEGKTQDEVIDARIFAELYVEDLQNLDTRHKMTFERTAPAADEEADKIIKELLDKNCITYDERLKIYNLESVCYRVKDQLIFTDIC